MWPSLSHLGNHHHRTWSTQPDSHSRRCCSWVLAVPSLASEPEASPPHSVMRYTPLCSCVHEPLCDFILQIVLLARVSTTSRTLVFQKFEVHLQLIIAQFLYVDCCRYRSKARGERRCRRMVCRCLRTAPRAQAQASRHQMLNAQLLRGGPIIEVVSRRRRRWQCSNDVLVGAEVLARLQQARLDVEHVFVDLDRATSIQWQL